MADNQLTVSVTRWPTSDLVLTQDGVYEFPADGFGDGDERYEVETVSAPAVHNEQPVAFRRTNTDVRWVVRVKASSTAQLAARMKTLRDAFRQPRFTVTVNTGAGNAYWHCYPQSQAVGANGVWDPELQGIHWQDLEVQFTRYG